MSDTAKNKNLEQLRKQLLVWQSDISVALLSIDALLGSDNKLPRASKKKPTHEERMQKYLNA